MSFIDTNNTTKNTAQTDKIEKPIARTGFWQGLLIFGLYTLLAALITYPFVLRLNTDIIGGTDAGDSFQNLWYMWWYKEAILAGQDPGRTHLMYGLLPSVQVLFSSIFNALWLMPIQLLFGPLFAYNLGIFASFPLAGLCAYLLAREFTPNRLAAFVAGFLYTFSTYHLYRAEAHLGLVTVQWLPFYAWRLFVLRRQPNWLNTLLAALGLALCALSDLYYLGYFVLPFTALFLLWSILFERKTFLSRAKLPYFVAAIGLGFLILLPFYFDFFQLDADVAQSVRARALDSAELSANLLNFFLPDARNPFFGSLTAPVYQTFKVSFPIEQAVYPGYILLIAAFAALFLKRWRNLNTFFWVVTAAAAFVLALGPRLHIAATEINLPLPYALLYGKLPFLSNFRAPGRFGLVVVLALCVLAALALTSLFEWLQTHLPFSLSLSASYPNQLKIVPALLALVLMLFAFAESTVYSWPLPTGPVTVPEIYRQIAAEPGEFLILELPLAPLSSPLYYQTIHKKPLVGGYPSRISNRMNLSFDQTPYLSMFNPAESSAVMDGSATKGQPDIFPIDISFKQALQQNNIRYVTLRNYPGGQRFFRWMQPYLETNLGAPNFKSADNNLLAWKVEPASSGLPALAPNSYRYRLGDGWNAGLGKADGGGLLRLLEQDGKINIETGSAGPATLKIKLTPYIRPQTLEVHLNGQIVGRIEAPKEWQSLEASLPNLSLKAGQNQLELHSVQGCLIAADYIPNSPDYRCISFAIQQIQLNP